MTDLRTAAQQALEALESKRFTSCGWRTDCDKAITDLRAALAEEALQNLTDVQQEMERNFCPRCGKRTNDIHTCTPPHEEHFCDTHCTWLDHAPGCVRAKPVAWLFTNLQSGDYDFCYREDEHDHDREMWHKQPLYAAPPQRKPLTEEAIAEIIDAVIGFNSCWGPEEKFARAIERAHGIGGQP